MKVHDGDDDIWDDVGTRHVEDAVGEAMDECASDRGINDCEKQGRLANQRNRVLKLVEEVEAKAGPLRVVVVGRL